MRFSGSRMGRLVAAWAAFSLSRTKAIRSAFLKVFTLSDFLSVVDATDPLGGFLQLLNARPQG